MTKKSDTKPTKSISKKQPEHPLVQKIDALLKKQGITFNNAVKKYHGYCVDHNLYDAIDEPKTLNRKINEQRKYSDEEKWVEKFKKFRTRIHTKKENLAYQHLKNFYEYLLGQGIVHPQPLLNLVENDPICEAMKKASKKIYQEIQDSDDENF